MPQSTIKEQVKPKSIEISGARMHNLKNVNVHIPRDKFTVITGLSGSGKSSLAFDTLYAEGQRRYVESLSAYARQFMGKLDKPDVDYINGISPAVAIQQKVKTSNPRSTVGTTTEIYDYLKLLFARIGRTFSPVSHTEVKRHSVDDVVQYILKENEGKQFFISSPLIKKNNRNTQEEIQMLVQQGFNRIILDGKIARIDQVDSKMNIDDAEVLIDRLSIKKDDEDFMNRLTDSVQTAFFEGNDSCYIHFLKDKKIEETRKFSNKFELDGISFEVPSPHLFAFNNPIGACKKCEGFGSVIGIDHDLVIPDHRKSVFDEAVICWKGEKMSEWKRQIIQTAHLSNFPIHRPIKELSKKEYDQLWKGSKYFEGLNTFFQMLEQNSYKIQYRVMLSRYRGKTLCPDCQGTRLRKDANYVKIDGKSISELVLTPVKKLTPWFTNLPSKLNDSEKDISQRLLKEINTRLSFLDQVGLNYLTLNRLSNTLSGGESQRISLSTILGSSLVGSIYILDEPSIGLHPKDSQQLLGVLQELKQKGNTVVVVEHEEDLMMAADHIIDMGPEAGSNGGEVVFEGNRDELIKSQYSLTAKYLTGRMGIPLPKSRRIWKKSIDIRGAVEQNLKNIDVSIPLNCLTVVTGVSGSGKSTLIGKVFYPALKKILGGNAGETGKFEELAGNIDAVSDVEYVDQNPIGKSSRSNPVTYIKAYDEIRSLYSKLPLSKLRGYKPAFYSFNVEGGRCETCKGEGEVTVEMQFMADIHLTCDVCKGRRFKQEVLEVEYKNKSIADILALTVDEAIAFFGEQKDTQAQKITKKLQPLQDVGLGYVQLGQSSSTLSGGEAQRIKLAAFLSLGNNAKPVLFIFDEPTTGLHFHDIQKLLDSMNALIARGHSILVIEHNMEVVKSADWVIDLGPEGGDDGGELVFSGTPEKLITEKRSYTGKWLKEKLNR